MTGKRFLYAPNIHQGGGRTLLLPLLEALKDEADVIFVLDARMALPKGVRLAGKVYLVNPTLLSRLCFEWRLRSLIKRNTLLLCLGNLPPLFAHQGEQRVFVQNRYLIDDVSLKSFPLSVRIRLMVERWWLRSNASYVHRFVVQTPTMQGLLRQTLGQEAEILPYAPSMKEPAHVLKNGRCYDFLYVASGEAHKSHKTLIEAWIKLAEAGHFPSLCLTLDATRFPELCAWIASRVKKFGLNISMLGECSYVKIQQLYHQSRAMIYPSRFESFGLPLIEAAMAGLPVLTGSETYVTDVIEPTAVFDPASPQSIADAVQAFQNKPAKLKVHLFDASEFLVHVFTEEALA